MENNEMKQNIVVEQPVVEPVAGAVVEPVVETVAQPSAVTVNVNMEGVKVEEKGSYALSIVSLVFGILSILVCCCSWPSLILGAVALICGIIAIKTKQAGKGMAIAGVVCGSISVALWLIEIICEFAAISLPFLTAFSL